MLGRAFGWREVFMVTSELRPAELQGMQPRAISTLTILQSDVRTLPHVSQRTDSLAGISANPAEGDCRTVPMLGTPANRHEDSLQVYLPGKSISG
jgi:hypothetical protein